jgi:hypothetical protein
MNVEKKMELETQNISLTKTELFWIIIKKQFQGKWLYWPILAVFLIYSAYNYTATGEIGLLALWIGITFMIFVLLPLLYLRYVNAQENAIFLLPRTYRVNNEVIYAEIDNNTKGETAWAHAIKALKIGNDFLVYISRQQFFFFPRRCFKSESDYQTFERLLIEKNLLKNKANTRNSQPK